MMASTAEFYLHTERFISLLKAIGGEELELVDVLPKNKVCPLADTQGASGHKGITLHLIEGCLRAACIHHQFSIKGEAWQHTF